MAILDKKLELSDAQSVSSDTTTEETLSTNVIDLGAANIQVGAGTPLMLNIRVNTAVTSAGAATLKFDIETGSSTSLGTTILTTGAIAKATLVAGYWVLRVPLPYEVLEQYLGVSYTVAAATLTGGKIDAWVELAGQSSYEISAEV